MSDMIQVFPSLPDALGAAAEFSEQSGMGYVLEREAYNGEDGGTYYQYGASAHGRDTEEIEAGWMIRYTVRMP